MNEVKVTHMSEQILEYICLEQFDKHNASTEEAMMVLHNVIVSLLKGISNEDDLGYEELITFLCNSLQMHLKKRHYTTGDEGADKVLDTIFAEIKAGADIEQVVDKYIHSETEELRQQVIEGLKSVRDNHSMDNVTIGYSS